MLALQTFDVLGHLTVQIRNNLLSFAAIRITEYIFTITPVNRFLYVPKIINVITTQCGVYNTRRAYL